MKDPLAVEGEEAAVGCEGVGGAEWLAGDAAEGGGEVAEVWVVGERGGDDDAEVVIEREQPAVEGAVVKGVEAEPVAGVGPGGLAFGPRDDVAGV